MRVSFGDTQIGRINPLHVKNDPNVNFDLLVRWLEESEKSSYQMAVFHGHESHRIE